MNLLRNTSVETSLCCFIQSRRGKDGPSSDRIMQITGHRNCHLCHFRKVEFHRLANNYVDALITQRKRRPSPEPKNFQAS
ncbi:hypothetical protein OIU77_008689, partial [Salix suchowensis]